MVNFDCVAFLAADVFQQSGTVSILESFNDIQPSQTFIGDREFGRFGANVEVRGHST